MSGIRLRWYGSKAATAAPDGAAPMNGARRIGSRILRALWFAWEAAPGWTVLSGTLVLIQGVLPLLSLYLMKLVVDTVVVALAAGHGRAAMTRFTLLVALSGLVALAAALCSSLARLANGA